MKHEEELQAILTALYAINKTSEHEDKEITLVLEYAFKRFYCANTNLVLLACIGKNKEQMMKEVMEVLTTFTQYKNYLEVIKQ